jgi:hypothetical protein
MKRRLFLRLTAGALALPALLAGLWRKLIRRGRCV